ncbi:MAG: hypothetical protein ACLQU4_21455 [Limisphaerales bacterium]
MNAEMGNIVQWPIALFAGAVLGAGFGMMQNTARRRYEKLQQSGALRSEWTVVRGSSRRIIVLLLALGLAQVICPFLFATGGQWWFSGGVLAGYGVILLRQLQLRRRIVTGQ